MPTEIKSINQPEETRPFDNGKVELVKIAGHSVGRASFEPGWKWSEAVKPIVGTDSCQVAHVGYVISGTLKGVMDDGTNFEISAGDAYAIPPGHDAWVDGNETFSAVEFESLAEYAKG
jgi:mannose-6-phosphate isomerase-like protein (cupin superfamily)